MPSFRTFEDGVFNILLTENKVNENVLERVAKIFNENSYKDFFNTIYQAVSSNNQDYLKWLKDNNLVSSNRYASRAFISAIDCDNYKMIDFLLQNGAECPKRLNKAINKSIETGDDLKLTIYSFCSSEKLPKDFSKGMYLSKKAYFNEYSSDLDEPHTGLYLG